MPLVERGVYSRPWLTAEGREVIVAVDYQSREVGCTTLEPGENRYTLLAEMWDLLDLQDPDHARRTQPRPDPQTLLTQDLEQIARTYGTPYSAEELESRINRYAADLLSRGWRRVGELSAVIAASIVLFG